MRTCRILVCGAAMVLLAGCGSWFEPPAVRNATELLHEGKVGDAIRIVEAYLKDQPDSLPAKRLRLWIFLKADRIDLAGDALRELPPADNTLARGLKHSDPLVRVGAAKLSALQPATVQLDVLADALDDPAADVRRYCARALGKRGDRRAVRPLFRIHQDDNWFVRAESVSALANLREPRAAGWFIFVLRDSDGFVRSTAADALHAVACEANQDLIRRAMNKALVPQKYFIACALAKLKDPAAYPLLLNALKQEDSSIRIQAVKALGEAGVVSATNALTALLNDSDEQVRQEVQRVLGKLRTAGAP